MNAKLKRRTVVENGDTRTAEDLVLTTLIGNDVGDSLLSKLDELLIKKNISEAIKMCKMCFHLLEPCAKCNALVSEGKFYPALKTIELVERDYLKNIPVKKLRVVVERRIPSLKAHIEKKVCSELNEWLVHIRTLAKEIGQTTIAHTALVRQKDEEMKAHQKELEENIVHSYQRLRTI